LKAGYSSVVDYHWLTCPAAASQNVAGSWLPHVPAAAAKMQLLATSSALLLLPLLLQQQVNCEAGGRPSPS
jgi:hypothetical protein